MRRPLCFSRRTLMVIGDRWLMTKAVGWACKRNSAIACRCVVSALASLSTVTVLAAVPVQAQNKIGPAGVCPQVRQPIRTKLAAGNGHSEAQFPESAQQLSPAQSPATGTSGSVSGVVLAEDGVAVPGAQITLTDISLVQQRTSISGAKKAMAQ